MSESSRYLLKKLKYRQVIEELEAAIVQLQITNEKLNGDGVNGLSYTELESLKSMLNQGLRSVEDQQDKAEVEYSTKKVADAKVMGDEWVDKIEEEDFAHEFHLTKRRRALRHKARELRLSSLDSQQQWDSPDHNYLLQLAEDIEVLKCEKETLVLWNQRMIGKELDGMGYIELRIFMREIQRGILSVTEEMVRSKQTSQSQSNERPGNI